MNAYYYVNPEVKYLLLNHSSRKEQLIYKEKMFSIPEIGARPPYYSHPRYEQYFAII